MKKKVISMILILCMLFMTACSSSGSGESPDSEYKDTIVFCNGNDISTLDGSIGQQERAVYLTNHIFDPLFTSKDFEIVPCLAEEYEWVDDETTLKIKLREGVKFHDGSDMTAEDVKFTMDLLQERGMTFGGNYKETEIVDDHNVLIHLNDPNPALINTLSMSQTCILPSDAYDPEAFAKNPIGTGPYKIYEYGEGDYYTLERFDDYWGEPAKTKYLTLKIVPEASQRAIMLETGEVDAAYSLSFNDIERFKEDEDIQVLSAPSTKVILLEANCSSDGPVGNAKVRRALECAIDKETIVNSLLSGYGEVAKSVISPNVADYRETSINEYDPEKAKELLKEAGYADGCELTLFTNADQVNGEIATVMQNQLAQVGITLKIVIQDDNTTFSMVENGEDFDLILDFFQIISLHAEYMFINAFTSSSFNNYSRYYNDEFDATYSKYCSTGEGPEREELLNKLYEMIQTDCPSIGIYTENKIVACSSKLEGLYVSPIGAHEYQNATLKK